MLRNVIQKVRQGRFFPGPDEKGQSIVIITFAFLGLIAMLGLALDLGLVYIEQTRIKRAVDAATLAGVSELPFEEGAFIQAVNYLDENGYNLRDFAGQPQVNIYMRGCSHHRFIDFVADPSDPAFFGNYGVSEDPPAPVYTDTASIDNTNRYVLYFPNTPVPDNQAVAEFFFDTGSFQDDGVPNGDCNDPGSGADSRGSAQKFRVEGRVPVRMNFMQFFGFDIVPVSDFSIAQNVTSLDVTVVFDVSGSMAFDTICHGCYDPFDEVFQGTGNRDAGFWTDLNYGHKYPMYAPDNPTDRDIDFFNPIPLSHLPTTNSNGDASPLAALGAANEQQLCFNRDGNTAGHFQAGGGGARNYVIIEAELYSRNNSIYERNFRQPGRGYWAVQHSSYRTTHRMYKNSSLERSFHTSDPDDTYETGATPILGSYSRGSFVRHQPYVSWSVEPVGVPGDLDYHPGVIFGKDYVLEDAQGVDRVVAGETIPPDLNIPSLEYNFHTSAIWGGSNPSGPTHIWVRAQGGRAGNADDTAEYFGQFFWTIYAADATGAPTGNPLLPIQVSPEPPAITDGPLYDAVDGDLWSWVNLTDVVAGGLELDNSSEYVLQIWAGGVGVSLDRIVIGNDDDANVDGALALNIDPTAGSADREACNRCNPIYGLTIGTQDECINPVDNGWSAGYVLGNNYNMQLRDSLFAGYQPLRDAKEATKRFAKRLKPKFDQLGYVAYNHGRIEAGIAELACKRREGTLCFEGSPAISYTNVLDVVERVPADGGTNIAQGMWDGLLVLGLGGTHAQLPLPGGHNNNCDGSINSHCGSTGSRKILIVMTDGVANADPNGQCDNDPSLYTPNLPTNTGDTARDNANNAVNQARDCVVYFANIASDRNVKIYTIGLGNGADAELLEKVAEIGGGAYFNALSPAQLDQVFDRILENISIRLIQ